MTKTRISLLFSVILSSMLFGCASTPPTAPATPAAATPEVQAPQPKPEPPPVQETVPTISPVLQSLRESMIQNNSPEAKLKAHAIIDNAPKSADAAEALRTLAEISMHEVKLGEAQLYADAAYAINPKDTQILLCLARLAILHEQNDVAVKHLKEAANLSPQDPLPHIMLANIQLQFLDTERALASAKTAFQLAPQNCNASIVYADALYASRAYPEAIAQYEAAQTQHCKIGEATLKNMAKLYEVHTQNPQKACAAYKRLHEIDANNPYYKASMDYQCNTQAATPSL
jgi:tetratricopeptide (TPR) repeat protein